MFICKRCGTKKRKLTKENAVCKKCGGEHFTTKKMVNVSKLFNQMLNKGL